jgi:Domain of unknown function (DUF427)
MNDFRSIGVPAEGGGSDIGRKALWVIRELGLPAIVKACVSCRSTRHHPTGKFRVNANGKLLDVWLLIGDQVTEDIAWSYPSPVPENPRIAGLICFRNERVDLTVDGLRLERPVTPWS